MTGDESTISITNIAEALQSVEEEAKGKAAFFLVMGGELNGTIFDLKQGTYTVGRSAENQIPLNFIGISRKHLSVVVKPGGEGGVTVSVTDLDSRNGTYLNNVRAEGTVQLRKGDILKLGPVALKYFPPGDPERLTYDKLNRSAATDGLTGCFNKSYFNASLELQVRKAGDTGESLSLVIFDLDHFKALNDSHGHDAGDFVLRAIAEVVRNAGIREADIFARFGGEEFVVLLPNTILQNALKIAERIRSRVAAYEFCFGGKRLPVTISVGVADRPTGAGGAELFRRADTALYLAKGGGRNRVNAYGGGGDDDPGTSAGQTHEITTA